MATKLPEDFPGRKQLEAAGFTTVEQLRALSPEQLDQVDGVGPKTLFDIREALSAGARAGTSEQPRTSTSPQGQQPAMMANALPSQAPVKVGEARSDNGTVATTIDPK